MTDEAIDKDKIEAAEEPVEDAPEEAVADEDAVEAERETVGEGAAPVEGEEVSETAAEEKKPRDPNLLWYVLRVQSNKEDTVRENLEKRIRMAGLQDQIVRVLVPTEKVSEMKGGKKRISERKIYPGYVLVEMIFNDETWYLVRETPGIGDFVGGAPNTKPMPMQQHEVDKILGEAEKEADESPRLKIEFREGDAVKITEGPFENFSGVVQEVLPAKGLVKVEVTIFGRPTPVELEYWQVESI